MSVFRLLKHTLPSMRQRGSGCVVLISSMMGILGSAQLSAYCATKWALLGLADSLRMELHRDGLRSAIPVIAVCPYAVRTGLFPGLFDASKAPGQANWLRDALCPVLTPAAVADAVVASIRRWRPAIVTIPWYAHWGVLACRLLLPLWALDWVVGWSGGWQGVSGLAMPVLAPTQAQGAAEPSHQADAEAGTDAGEPTAAGTERIESTASARAGAPAADSLDGSARPNSVRARRRGRSSSGIASLSVKATGTGTGSTAHAASVNGNS